MKKAAKPAAAGMMDISKYFKPAAAQQQAPGATQQAVKPAPAKPAPPPSLVSPPPSRKAEPSSTGSSASSGARERAVKTVEKPAKKPQVIVADDDDEGEEEGTLVPPRRKRLVKRVTVVESDEEAAGAAGEDEDDVTPAKRQRSDEAAPGAAGEAGKASSSPAGDEAAVMDVDLTASSPEDAAPPDSGSAKARRRGGRGSAKSRVAGRSGGDAGSGESEGGSDAEGDTGPARPVQAGAFQPNLAKRKRFAQILGPAPQRGEAEPDAEGAARGVGRALSGERYEDILARAREKKSGYTPLEVQWLEVKVAHPDAVLFVEVGYKFRFLDRDAEVAARVLSIFASHDKNFRTASIPTHRLAVHARRLVEAGYKVGVVRQTETAALKKAGDNRSGPFQRELTALYTKATLVGGGLESLSGSAGQADGAASLARHLLCVWEERPAEEHEKVAVCLVAVDAGTGDVVFDRFHDGVLRSELETRLRYLQPAELVAPERGGLSAGTERLFALFGAFEGDGEPPPAALRLERYPAPDFAYPAALDRLAALSASAAPAGGEGSKGVALQLQEALQMPEGCVRCLGVLAQHLAAFGLADVLRLPAAGAGGSSFRHFSSRTTMLLSASALANLEILRNATDNTERGSLVALLSSQPGGPQTAFGGRQLRAWVSRPLLQRAEIVARQEAVQELLDGALAPLREALRGVPDLERGLARIAYRKITPAEFCPLMHAFARLAKAAPDAAGLQSALLREWADAPTLRAAGRAAEAALARLDGRAAAKSALEALFAPSLSDWPELEAAEAEIAKAEGELQRELTTIRKELNCSDLKYVQVAGEEYLVELENKDAAKREAERRGYKLVVALKHVSRYRTRRAEEELLPRVQRGREARRLAAERAWGAFLAGLAEGDSFAALRAVVRRLAALDAAAALAACARLPGYVRPTIADAKEGPLLVVRGARHAMVEAAMGGSGYVPNDVELRAAGPRCLLLTGPNMGGKSSYIRQTALIAVLAQVGAWVPADACTLAPFDAVHTRMGARDDIGRGLSTFMVELQEAAVVLKSVTRRSLVILDELGRGTSTHDGTAIAFATLQHLVASVQCATLFVTHYPLLGALERALPGRLANAHMAFLEHDDGQEDAPGLRRITFLYKVTRGLADRSYGLNVARLARLPPALLATAARKAAHMEAATAARAPAPPAAEGEGEGEAAEAGPLEGRFREAYLALGAHGEGPTRADARHILARLSEHLGPASP